MMLMPEYTRNNELRTKLEADLYGLEHRIANMTRIRNDLVESYLDPDTPLDSAQALQLELAAASDSDSGVSLTPPIDLLPGQQNQHADNNVDGSDLELTRLQSRESSANLPLIEREVNRIRRLKATNFWIKHWDAERESLVAELETLCQRMNCSEDA